MNSCKENKNIKNDFRYLRYRKLLRPTDVNIEVITYIGGYIKEILEKSFKSGYRDVEFISIDLNVIRGHQSEASVKSSNRFQR